MTGESEREQERDPASAAARMPRRVFEVVREALTQGPVLVHNPRFGYQPALACATCRAAGALPTLPGTAGPTLGRCRTRLPLVRPRPRVLGLPSLPGRPVAFARRRVAAHGGGVGPQLRVRAGGDVRR